MPGSVFPAVLLTLVLAVLAWSGIAPHDRLTWWLEVTPALIGLAILLPTRRRFPLTSLVYIALHMMILCVGAKYTYALVPAGDWVRDLLGAARNPYDRLGHLAQGFVPAMIAREIFIRKHVIASAAWRAFLVVCVCVAFSAVYELVEWLVAITSGEASDAFLGTQGDNWDTQKDMFMALIGATTALATLSHWHDRQLARLSSRLQRGLAS